MLSVFILKQPIPFLFQATTGLPKYLETPKSRFDKFECVTFNFFVSFYFNIVTKLHIFSPFLKKDLNKNKVNLKRLKNIFFFSLDLNSSDVTLD